MTTKAYTQAANTGKYDKKSGLLGKYDNVRRLWEDQVTGIFLRPALNELVERKRARLERIRVLDLGSGSGDGYDLMMGVNTKDPGIYEYITEALTPDMLREYVGLEINTDLLRQANEYYTQNHKVRFLQGDMSTGLPKDITQQEPFDIYFTSYGTLSHFRDEQNIHLIADIFRHAADGALFVGDWLGRYSYEWQDLWHHPADREYFMDYRISYIYSEEERATANVESFPLRLMSRDEILGIIDSAAKEAGVAIKHHALFDRSVLIGRHMDTNDYNKYSTTNRQPVNSLFEGYVRTDLERLLVDYVPRPGFDHLNNFYESFFMSCNALVKYTMDLLQGYDPDLQKCNELPPVHPYYPDPLKRAMNTMRKVIEGMGWVRWGDVRANVIEPQLGYSLREMEMCFQKGMGTGHSLVGVFEVTR
jgi:hypothetical protein